MFCSECGTKNNDYALFCENCGHKIKEAKTVKVKTNKPKDKKKTMITYIIVGVVILLIAAYLFISNMFSPKKVAEGFFNAVVSLDANMLYDYIDVEDSEFTTKKMFEKVMSNSNKKKVEIVNYTVEKPIISKDKLSATVKISYVSKDNKNTQTATVKLIKNKNNKLLLFDNWKVNTDGYSVIKDFEFQLPKDSVLEVEGKKVDKKYIKETDEDLDIYVMPYMFSTGYNVKVTLPIGIEIEDIVEVNSYSDYDVDLSEDNLSDEMKKTLKDVSKTALENIYNNAKDKKTWDEVKSTFEYKNGDLKDVKESYESLVSSLTSSSSTLTNISFTKIDLNRVSLTDEGYLYLSVKATYDFTVSYQSGDETKTNSSDDYDYIYLTFDYQNKEFKLVDVTSLNTYFSRYY